MFLELRSSHIKKKVGSYIKDLYLLVEVIMLDVT